MKRKLSKKALWIIISCAAALLIAAGTVTSVLIINGNREDAAADAQKYQIYWNVDRQYFYGNGENGVSSRTVNTEDGYYHILLACDGRPIERKTRSMSVVNKIDNVDAMGLVVDEKTRDITDVVPLSDLGASYLCKRYYISEIKGNTIVANSSFSLRGKDKTVALKTATPIYDVSIEAQSDAGMPVKLESLVQKDQITVIQNKDKSIYAVYVTKRYRKAPVYWNVERKYDSKALITTRQPDENGVYSILMAVEGKQVTVKCKDMSVVSTIDSFANKSCGLEFDNEGYVTNAIAAAKVTGGKSVASWYDVLNINELNFVAEKHSSSDKGKQVDLIMDENCGVYNVSTNHEKFIGEETTLQVGDRVQGFTDAYGKVVVLFVVRRPKKSDFYWNIYKMYDSTNKVSTRVRESDGYFHVLMCHNGKEVEVLVADQEMMNKIDGTASYSMGLNVVNNIVVGYTSPSDMYESTASWYDIQSFVSDKTVRAKKTIKAKDTGKETEFDISDNCKVYNITQAFDDHIGEETTLRVGDRIQAWKDYSGKVIYIYVVYRPVNYQAVAHNNHVCEECGNNVKWIPWTSGNTLPDTSGHYYLCGNVCAKQTNVLENQNVVLCLNGYTVKPTNKRIYATFEKNSKLSIHDCTGKGKMLSTYRGDIGTTQGPIIWARYGTLNLFGGTYIAPAITVKNNGAVICSAANTTITIKNSTIIGGTTAKRGGGVFMDKNSTLNIIDSTIKAGTSLVGEGDALAVGNNVKINLSGKVVINGGKSNFYKSGTSTVTLTDSLAAGSSIGVTLLPTGRITTNYFAGNEQYFTSDNPDYAVHQNGEYIFIGNKLTDHKTTHICEECDQDVTWIPWTFAGSLPTQSGHYYLCGNVTTGQNTLEKGQNVVLCLNGYTVKGTGSRIYSTSGKLTITDCTGNGKMYNGKTSDLGTTQGALFWVRSGTLNLLGGTFDASGVKTSGKGVIICAESSTAVNIQNAKLIGGKTTRVNDNVNTGNGGVIALYGSSKLSMSNVNIIAGKAEGGLGDAIYMSDTSNLSVKGLVNIQGGTTQIYQEKGAFLTFAGTLSEGSNMNVATANDFGKISTNYVSGVENYINGDHPAYSVDVISGALYINTDFEVPEHLSAHKCEHCGKTVTWEAWINANTLPTKTGHYYLCFDVTTEQNNVTANEDVVLCLNGHTVKGTGNRVYSTFEKGAKLTITDCAGTGRIYNGKTASLGTTQGTVFWVRYGTLNLFGGTYDGSGVTTNGRGVVICADVSTTVNVSDATIIGGTTVRVDGNENTGNGGAIAALSQAKINLKNVDIISGKAEGGLGDAVYLKEGAVLTLSGKINISGGVAQVYLDSDSLITFSGALSEGSNIVVAADNTDGKISTNYYDGVLDCISSTDESINIIKKNNALYLLDQNAVVPEHATAHTCEHCETAVEWTAWTEKTALPTVSGHYYLCYDVTTPQNTIAENEDVVLCLNGHTVKGTENRVYTSLGKSLTVTDCGGTGRIYNGKTANLGTTQGAVFWIRKGKLNLFGGTFDGSGVTTNGRGVVICAESSTVITIENADIIGGTSVRIDGNYNTGNGGAIAMTGSSSLKLKNANITAGVAENGWGDAIYMGGTSTLTLSGKVKIIGGSSQVRLAEGAFITFGGALESGSSIVVNTDNAEGKISTNYVSGALDCVIAEDTAKTVVEKNGILYIKDIIPEHNNTHNCKHCETAVEWTAWTDTTKLPTSSGHYYLTEDVITAQNNIPENEDVVLCLNGHTVKGTGSRVYSSLGKSLTVTDCIGKGRIYNGKTASLGTTQGAVFWIRKGKLNLFGGTYDGSGVTTNGRGVVICAESSTVITIENADIIGGKTVRIDGNYNTGNGGAIAMTGSSMLKLKDANITAGVAEDGFGDAIYMGGTSTLMLSGKVNIIGGTSQVYLNETAFITVNDLDGESSIGVTTANSSGKITTNYISEMETCFISNKEGHIITVSDGALYLTASNTPKNGKVVLSDVKVTMLYLKNCVVNPALSTIKEVLR